MKSLPGLVPARQERVGWVMLQRMQHAPGAGAIKDVLIIHEQDRSRAAGAGCAHVRAVAWGIQQWQAEQAQKDSGAHEDCLSEPGGCWQVRSAWTF